MCGKTSILRLLLLLVAFLGFISGSKSQTTVFDIPEDSSGIPLANEEELSNQNESGLLLSNDPRHVAFYLYPNPDNITDNDVIMIGNSESLSTSRYDAAKPALFIIHGFLNNYTTRYSQTVKNEFLKQGFSKTLNILVVDWGKLATPANLTAWLSQIHDPLKDLYYRASVNNVPKVGKVVSEFISFLISEQRLESPANVTLLGFSLGAQISGYAGKFVKQNNTILIGRITGLDPAGPLYQSAPANEKLNANDGTFVDIVKTGTADFYPNGGGPNQSDCLDIGVELVPNTISGTCAHNRAWIYYLAGLSKNITACACISQADPIICRMFCKNKVRFGFHCPPTASGGYYFDIYAKDP
ncbi:Endothelial lipase [Folsomia candida]|uniref:Endothelial lipase n=1 Tax=Folsomia candida TaxID=158441 RepID=A0A226EKX1_FOLCA|nr:Endothelial lipase [Folsomia candida]